MALVFSNREMELLIEALSDKVEDLEEDGDETASLCDELEALEEKLEFEKRIRQPYEGGA